MGIADQGCMTLTKRCHEVRRIAAIQRVRRLGEAARLLGAAG